MPQSAWAIVQAEHRFYQASKLLRNMNRTGRAAVRPAFVVVLHHLDEKDFAEIAGAASKHDAMAHHGTLDNLESVGARKTLDLSQIVSMRAVAALEFFP